MKQVSERPATAGLQPGPPRKHARAKHTRRQRALVLGPLFTCLLIGVFLHFLIPGTTGAVFITLPLAASVLWIVVAGLALALGRAFRHADRVFFKHQDHTPGDGAGTDWDTRTGSFAWMEDWEGIQFDHDDYHH